jgi:hypothetical protein
MKRSAAIIIEPDETLQIVRQIVALTKNYQ